MVRFTLRFFFRYVWECGDCLWFHAYHRLAGHALEATIGDVLRYCRGHLRVAVGVYRGSWRYDRHREAMRLFKVYRRSLKKWGNVDDGV